MADPQHITGALFESRHPLGKDGAVQVSGGVGAAPAVRTGSWIAIDLIGTTREAPALGDGAPRVPAAVRRASSMGLLFGTMTFLSAVPVPSRLCTRMLRSSASTGAYIDWMADPWRIVAANYYVDIALTETGRNESFSVGLPASRKAAARRFTIFAVWKIRRACRSRYVALIRRCRRRYRELRYGASSGVRWTIPAPGVDLELIP